MTLTCFVLFFACKGKQSNVAEVEKAADNKTETVNDSTKAMNKIILCFGNSLTAGYGLTEEEAWPALLQERLDSMDYQYRVINAGLSGETSSGGLNRIDWVLRQKVDIFILELGANDMLRGLDVKETEKNLGQIITKYKEANPEGKVLLAGMKSPPNMGPEYEKNFNGIYKSLSEAHETALVPFFLEGVAANEKLLLEDAKHPNSEGQKILLENIWNQLKHLI